MGRWRTGGGDLYLGFNVWGGGVATGQVWAGEQTIQQAVAVRVDH